MGCLASNGAVAIVLLFSKHTTSFSKLYLQVFFLINDRVFEEVAEEGVVAFYNKDILIVFFSFSMYC
jgi:hypothetical protein